MRNAFSDGLVNLARQDPSVLLLTGDHGYALFDEFRKRCESQYINAGIAEQNMVGVAAGLARTGFRPIVYGLSAFIPIRVLEQIKLDVCHDDLPVVFIGDGAGVVYSQLGTSHQSTEDVACCRAIPNLTILSPADRYEMAACMQLAYDLNKPVYLRMGKSDVGDVHSSIPQLGLGNVLQIKAGTGGIQFVATGSMVRRAIDISAHYENSGVWSVPTIKTVNAEQVAKLCRGSDLIVTMEEHSIHGGLGSLIAEIASERAPVRICRIGIDDRFSEYCGSYTYLMKEHRLDLASVKARIDSCLT
jgi:transketolase